MLIKSKKIRGNDKPYTSQKIRKEIVIRSRLKNKGIKTKLPENLRLYKTQRNKVFALISRAGNNGRSAVK